MKSDLGNHITHHSVAYVLRSLLRIPCLFALIFSTACSSMWSEKGPSEPYRSFYHTVQRGETLEQIGEMYGVPYDDIAELNKISDPGNLRINSRLLIRKPMTMRAAKASPKVMTFRRTSLGQGPAVQNRKGKLLWPLSIGEIVSTFGPRSSSFHDGIDIAAEKGTPVYASHSGTVVYSGNDLSGYGNLLILKNRSGVITIYAHNSKLLVEMGEKVRRGQRIAAVGATGRASGPHLHFEVRIKDKKNRYVAIDPLPLLEGDVDHGSRYRVNESLTPIIAKWIGWE